MHRKVSALSLASALLIPLFSAGCVPAWEYGLREADTSVPANFDGSPEATKQEPKASPKDAEPAPAEQSSGKLEAKEFFSDPDLNVLVDAALKSNQELSMATLEIMISRNEVMAREGEYLPKVSLKAGARGYREGEDYTQFENEGEPSAEYVLGLFASWEIDIWGKLRNAKTAAAKRYLASLQGRRFVETNLVAEVASSYYELIALDNQLRVLNENVEIQRQALEVVKFQKAAGKVTELAVKRFEAEVFKNRSRRFYIRQKILETENTLNFLAGRFRQPIRRRSLGFMEQTPRVVREGIPADLLENRPDVRRAELALEAAKLDVEVAKAHFYPSLELNAGVAIQQAFELAEFPSSPFSLAYGLAADLVQPIWNRKGIKANYFSSNAMQMQAVVDYERTILNAYTEVANQVSRVGNLQKSYDLRAEEVARLTESISISSDLFNSARADYMEVLLTRRDALEAQMELIETKGRQMNAMVKLYRALGGGWK